MAPSVEVLSPSGLEPYYSQGLRNRYRVDALKPPFFEKASQVYADMEYEVDEGKFRARSEARLQAVSLEMDVPAGWPKVLHGPLVWTGANFEDKTEGSE
jgi:hypothetical protein